MYFLQHSSYCQSDSAKFAIAPFFVPPPTPTGRPPDWSWRQLACFLPPADPQHRERCPRWSKSCGGHRCDHLAHSESLLLRLLVKQFDRSAVRLLESARSLWRVAWTIFNRHIVGLSEFHDTLADHSPLWRRYWCRGEISLIRRCSRPFSYFSFW